MVPGSLGGLPYYEEFVRTPTYNWVAVLDTKLAALRLLQIAAARLLARVGGQLEHIQPRVGMRSLHPRGVGQAGFVALFTVPAKPTTPVFVAQIAIPILRLVGNLRSAVQTVLAVTATALELGVKAVLSGVWLPRFVAAFFLAIERTVLMIERGLRGALLAVAWFPSGSVLDPRTISALVLVLTVTFLICGRSLLGCV